MDTPLILVADPDSSGSERLLTDPLVQKIPLKCTLFGMEAQRVLADKKVRVCGLFVSPHVDSTNVFSIVKSSLFHRPSTPIYFLGEESDFPEMASSTLKRLGVKGWVSKVGLKYKTMADLVAPLAVGFSVGDLLTQTDLKDQVKVGGELTELDQEFIAISAAEFVSGSTSCFDVYVRLGSGKYLKILLAGDGFTAERVDGYLKKGVTHFYLRKEAQEDYLRFCDTISHALLKAPNIPLAIKAGKILNQGSETFAFLAQQGVSEKTLREGAKFISNVRLLILQSDLQSNDQISLLLENAQAAEHSAATTMLSAMLCQSLEIQMEKPIQIVGAAAVLHHVGLLSLPESLWDEDESKMSKDEHEIFERHPEISAQILRKARGVDSAAIQAIEQHHVRRSGLGFPKGVSTSNINRVAEILGICSEFAHMVKKAKSNSAYELQRLAEQDLLPRFGTQISYAFRSTFFAKSRTPAITQ